MCVRFVQDSHLIGQHNAGCVFPTKACVSKQRCGAAPSLPSNSGRLRVRVRVRVRVFYLGVGRCQIEIELRSKVFERGWSPAQMRMKERLEYEAPIGFWLCLAVYRVFAGGGDGDQNQAVRPGIYP